MKWRSHKAHYLDALNYMKGKQQKIIPSFKTPWGSFNRATLNGIEFNTITVIGGRPASGKTLLVDQIIREGFKLNPGLNLRVLQFQLEMLGRTTKLREFSSFSKKTYRELCSADEDFPISNEIIKKCHEYAKEASKYPIDIIDETVTVLQFRAEIMAYMKEHGITKDDGKIVYPHTVVTLDHSVLIKKGTDESNKQETLANLGEVCTELKKKYPIAFILLTQLNRDTDRPERNEDGKYGNHILESDIYGGDGLVQHADLVVGINRPAKRFINYYGPERYIIKDETTLVLHWIKSRNGDIGMSFFEAEFHNMQIKEMETPGQDIQQGIKTKKDGN
jgi:replicative DNA helicase